MIWLLPLVALLVPGLAAFLLSRRRGRAAAGLVLAAVFAGLALWDLAGASGAAHDDAAAVNRVLRALLIWAPAVVSALAGSLAGRLVARRLPRR